MGDYSALKRNELASPGQTPGNRNCTWRGEGSQSRKATFGTIPAEGHSSRFAAPETKTFKNVCKRPRYWRLSDLTGEDAARLGHPVSSLPFSLLCEALPFVHMKFSLPSEFLQDGPPALCQGFLFYRPRSPRLRKDRYSPKAGELAQDRQNFQEIFQILGFPTASPPREFARGLASLCVQVCARSSLTPGTESSLSPSVWRVTEAIVGSIRGSQQDPDFD